MRKQLIFSILHIFNVIFIFGLILEFREIKGKKPQETVDKNLGRVLDIIFIGKRKQNNGNYTDMKTIESEESLTALSLTSDGAEVRNRFWDQDQSLGINKSHFMQRTWQGHGDMADARQM